MHRFVFRLSAALTAIALASGAHAQGDDAFTPIPDPPDTRYFEGDVPPPPAVLRSLPISPTYRAFLPPSVDLSSRMPPPGRQGRLGSCTAWAVGYAARSYYTETLEGRDLRTAKNLPSPGYIYHLARKDDPKCEKGTSVPQIVDIMRQGALSLAEYPYSDQCSPPASAQQVSHAADFRVRGMRRVDVSKIDNIKGQLASGNPVIFSFLDTDVFRRWRGGAVFTESLPDKETPGRHAMTFVGYDDARQAFRLINSWGRGWGDRGYAWLSYDLVKSRVTHAYTLDVAPPAPRPVVVAEVPKPPVAQPVTPPRPVTPPAPAPTPVVQPAPQPVIPPPAPKPVAQPIAVPVPPTPSPPPAPPQPKAELADLQKISCGKVSAQSRDNRTVLAGFVGSENDLALVQRVATDVPNTVVGTVALAPWPQCEALLTLEKTLALNDTPKFGELPEELKAADNFKFDIQSPGQINYLYISYIQADGSVLHLVQPRGLVPKPTLPGTKMTFGDGRDGRARFTVGSPFGREMVIALASRSPLFERELPAKQTEREYLTALRRALIYKPSPDMPDREVTASIKLIRTKAR